MENKNGSNFPSDLTGMKFHHLTVVKEAEYKICNNGKKVRMWECRCDCGKTKILNRQVLIRGKSKSCGCMHDYYARVNNTLHGDSHTRLHNIWSGMRERCYTKTDFHYKWYGERGIIVCNEWRDNYIAFRDWAYSNGYKDNLSIDRIDNDGPYSPDNCRWASQREQCNNTRRNHYLTINGDTHTLTEWSRISGINQSTIRRRIKIGWSPVEAVFKEKRTSVDGKYKKNLDFVDVYNEYFWENVRKKENET